MRKNYLSAILVVIALSLASLSCNKSSDFNASSVITSDYLPTQVSAQLQSSKENLLAQKIDASIISYQFKLELKDDNDVAALRQELIADDKFVPDFDGSNAATFSVSTIKERMSKYRKNQQSEQNVVQNLEQLVFPTIKKGQKVLAILWKANGKQFTSTCVYNNEGIVYDNILSNIAITTEKREDESRHSASRLKPNPTQTARQYSFTSTARDVTITWIWGGTRGKVVIKHYIIWNGSNYIYDHGGTVDAWMSGGSASGRWANNYLSRRSRSKLAWGYGWATPTASFSIKYNSSNITFSASTSGIGSKGSGDGIHTIYL